MKNKYFIRVVAIVLAVIMLISVVMIGISVLADSRASARVTQTQINELRSEQRDLERRRREIQSTINTIEFERRTELAKKDVLDQRIMITSLEIDNMNSIIEYFVRLIREKEYEVFLAQQREDDQLARFRSRVRDMEEHGIMSYLEIIFGATSFIDMLARLDFVSDIMRADERAYLNLVEAREETKAAQEALVQTKEELDEEKILLEEKEAELLVQLDEAIALIERLEADIETERQLRAQVVADEERVLREINAAVAELDRQRELERQRRLREQQQQRAQGSAGIGNVVGTGELMWPASGPITSAFGTRFHPVFREMRMHNGIDIGAPNRSSVVAADAGTVITSTYNSSYGNFIVICHGNGMQTLYAHLSTRSVSVGASVSRGQQIGLVGSTGVSTGPHLHFEVIVNGSRVNPRTRLS